MTLVLTLIAAAAAGRAALPGRAAAIAGMLPLAAAPDWLAPGIACDLPLGIVDAAAAEAVARTAIGDAAIDFVVQPAAGRRKRLLVADLESTIIANEMLDEMAGFLGRGDEVAAITRQAMNGEIDFIGALAARVAMLGGQPIALLDRAAARIRVTAGAAALVATMRRAGATTALVSGGFTVFAEPVAAALGFDRVVANRLAIADGRIAGQVTPPIVTAAVKRETLAALCAELGLAPEATLAVGDGANDLAMLREAGLGVAFHAKPAVAAASRWRIDHGDLTALLYAQGYRAGDIIDPPPRVPAQP